MGYFIVRLIINTLALLTVAYTLPGVHVETLLVAVVAALVFALINSFIKPVILIITLPINVLSLGIFTFFINGVLFLFVSKLVRGFSVDGFWNAFWGALIFSLVSFLLNLFFGKNNGNSRFYYQVKRGHNNRDLPSGSERFKDAIDAEVVENKQDEKK